MLIRPASVNHIESKSELHIEFVPQLTTELEPDTLTLVVPNTVGANHPGDVDTIDVDIMSVDVTIEPDVGIRMLPGTHGGGQPKLDMDGLPNTDWDM